MKKLKELSSASFLLIFILIAIIPTLYHIFITFAINYYWFESLNFKEIFLKIIKVKINLFLIFFSITFLISTINHLISIYNISNGVKKITINIKNYNKIIKKYIYLIIFIIALIFSIIPAASWWDTILRYFNATAFHIKDPLFHKDIGFYVFKLNLFSLIRIWSLYFLLFLFTWAFLSYFFTGNIILSIKKIYISKPIRTHLGILLFLIFLNISFYFLMKQYFLLFKQHIIVKGPSYTDVFAYLLSYKVLAISIFFTSFLFIYWIFNNKFNIPLLAILINFILLLGLNGVYPFILQQFIVSPNEIEKERPFIENTIKYTRMAYKIDKVKEKYFDVKFDLNLNHLEKNEDILDNIRLWDWRPLKETFKQLQEIRPYYIFSDVDIDRYIIENKMWQVMLSVREISHSNLPRSARNWINRYLKYTHGYGIVMTPVNKKNEEGLPEFFIKNIPPISTVNVKINRPEIYYGETMSDYVIVNTRTAELDYPSGDGNIYTYYKGDGGIKLDSYFKKLLFSLYLPNLKMLLSDLITPQSRVMIHRNIIEIVKKIAPFLLIDNDPYAVLVNGKIYWILDAYTYTDKFPYSELYLNELNYIRNSIKIIIDAYTGKTKFYIVDNKDPIAKTYKKIYPSLFSDYKKLNKEFIKHFRYPSDLFLIQADLYRTYHMKKADVFYNKEDYWDFPMELYDEHEIRMNNYYIINKLNNSNQSEFLNVIPFTPSKKNNMIALLIGRCDIPHYGELIVYKFPKRYLIYGPMQIEARIDQNAEISKLISLWGQKGSKVIRGNLLVIPVENSLIYVEPLFLQAEKQELPELKRIIVAYNNNVAIGETLQEALKKAITGNNEENINEEINLEKKNLKNRLNSQLINLIDKAYNTYQKADEYLKKGDLVNYARVMKKLKTILKRLKESK